MADSLNKTLCVEEWSVADAAGGCEHKDLFPLTSADGFATLAMAVASVLGGAAGIGGGGLNVPLLMLTLSFSVKEAVHISHVAVLGNAIAQNSINLLRRHPLTRSRPLVDFGLPLLLLPAQLAGNSLGVLVGKVLPSTTIELCACVLLFATGIKTLRTGLKQYRKECKNVAPALEDRGTTEKDSADLLPDGAKSHLPSDADGAVASTREPMSESILQAMAGMVMRGLGCGERDSNRFSHLPSDPVPITEPSAAPATAAAVAVEVQSVVQAKRERTIAFKLVLLVAFWLFFVVDFFGAKVLWGDMG